MTLTSFSPDHPFPASGYHVTAPFAANHPAAHHIMRTNGPTLDPPLEIGESIGESIGDVGRDS